MGRKYLIILLLLFALGASGQITVQFVPEIYGRSVDGLFNCKIFNPYQKLDASLTITVTERKGGTVCIIKTVSFSIYPGANPIPGGAAGAASVRYGNTRLGQLTGINHNFPEGDYDYCFDLNFTHSDNPPEEQCFTYSLAPFTELSLIDPTDRDSICDKRPLFSWQPLIPGVPGAFYQLVLTTINSGQNATEAINYNVPVINQYSIISPVLPYPPINPELVSGQKYAWQVTAYKDQTVLIRSEVWQFTVNCRDSTKAVPDDGYRDVEDLLKGNYYIATGLMKFAIENPYRAQTLRYEIISTARPDKKIKHLPKILLRTGSNKIKINLTALDTFDNEAYYILKLWLPDGTVKTLRFLYEDFK